jgi:predicted alpha/beta superfamily hydrolase
LLFDKVSGRRLTQIKICVDLRNLRPKVLINDNMSYPLVVFLIRWKSNAVPLAGLKFSACLKNLLRPLKIVPPKKIHMHKKKIIACILLLALMLSASVVMAQNPTSQEPQLTFMVIAPASTPPEAKIFIAGNHPLLGNWDPGKIELTKQNDSVWTLACSFPKKFGLEFKITRGTWNAQAIYQAGVIPGNTQLMVDQDTTITIRPGSWSDIAFKPTGGITGAVKYHRGLQHPKLRHARDVIVWLPPSYEKNQRQRYPVLYMHDGQNLFDPSTSFLGADWRVDEVADSLIRLKKIEEIIVVGIYNTPDRTPEYSDTELGRAYANFVIHHLKPMIDSTYRTKPEAKSTAVMGSSMGGLISFLFVWWHPEIFSKAGCLSSAFLVDDNKILREVRAYTGPKKPIRVYLDDGSEGLEARLKPGYDEMVALLLEKGYAKGTDLEYFYDVGAEHNERAWAKRLWRPLGFMFAR